MRRLPIFIVLLIAPAAFATEQPGPDDVLVQVMTAGVPHDQRERPRFLWDQFANKPQERKFIYHSRTAQWKKDFAVFADALVRKAREQSLNADALHRALDRILRESDPNVAYLPVGAYQSTLDGKPVWIVTVDWENLSMRVGTDPEDIKMGHIRMFAYDQKSGERVGFMTCD